jgi:HPt (histidine-containing phosphotransfer) domain-containing protein
LCKSNTLLTMKNNISTTMAFQFNHALDTRYLNEIFAGDPENALYILKIFLEELPPTLTHINAALNNNNKNELYEILHKTKTSFSFAGLTHIGAMMENIEKQCLQVNETRELEAAVKHLFSEINLWTPMVEKEYARLNRHTGI